MRSRYKLTRTGGFTIKVSNDLVRVLLSASAELRGHPVRTNYWIHDGGSIVQVWFDEKGELNTRYHYNWGNENAELETEVHRILTTYMPKRKDHS